MRCYLTAFQYKGPPPCDYQTPGLYEISISEQDGLLFFTLLKGVSILSPELFNPACSIYKFLFPGKKRVTLRTDLNLYLLTC